MVIQKASSQRIWTDIKTLDKYNDTPGEGTTRVLFTEVELGGREYIKKRMRENGLEVREDAIGNIYGKLPGTEKDLAPVWTGSHIDTVLKGGMFDGTIGVIGGMEALRQINESGLIHKRDIEVIVFTSEEPTRFGLGCLGSRALAGELTIKDMEALRDKDGITLAQTLRTVGYNLSEYSNVKKKKGDVFASVELHIEQGAVLERKNIKIGVVTTISAPTDISISIKGTQEHAGATPMYMRKDALSAAAEIILQIEGFARNSENDNTVATVGKLQIFPGATNVVPGEVRFSVDMRSPVMSEKEKMISNLEQVIERVKAVREVEITKKMVTNDTPTKADPMIVKKIESVCNRSGSKYLRMVSGAYHDSMFVSKFAPFGMIFIPCREGISHDKDEWAELEDIAMGTDLLAETLFELSNEV